MIKVLIAENVAGHRAKLRELLSRGSDLAIVGEAEHGAQALTLARRLKPEVVVMGTLERSPNPQKAMDELAVTRAIMAEIPTPIVVVIDEPSDCERRGQALLSAGAVAVLAGSRLRDAGDGERNELLEAVRIMSGVKVVGQRLRSARPTKPKERERGVQCVAIAASTGGPHAITRVLSGLPKDLPVPVIIVQHMAEGFVRGFASWLDGHCALPVKLVERTERMRPGVAYVAADNAHLRVMKHRPSDDLSAEQPWYALHPTPGEPIEGFMPSASVLFESLADAYGAAALAVILTGMGRDGLSGLSKVRQHGGRILAQNQETSVVFGMPHVAIEAGLADFVLPIDRMAAQILELVRAPRSLHDPRADRRR